MHTEWIKFTTANLQRLGGTFYCVVFAEVCKSYGITPIGFNIKKTPCVGKPIKNLFVVVGEGISGCSV